MRRNIEHKLDQAKEGRRSTNSKTLYNYFEGKIQAFEEVLALMTKLEFQEKELNTKTMEISEEQFLGGEIEYEDEHVVVLLENATVIIPSHKLVEHFKLENERLVETGHVGLRWDGGPLPKFGEEWQTRTDTEAVEEDLDIGHLWEYIEEGGNFEIEKV